MATTDERLLALETWKTQHVKDHVAKPLHTHPPVYTFEDNFDGTVLSSKWGRHWQFGVASFDRTQTKVANGQLSITAQKQADGSWKSDLIDTLGAFAQKYGYFEARIKIPRGNGLWPAFWLAIPPGSVGWPQEIDIVEVLANEVGNHGGLDVTYPISTIHFADGTEANYGKHVVDLSLAFHTFALDWRADHLIFYLDGVEFWRYTGPGIPSVAMPVILNLAAGGSWGGPTDGSTPSPSVMLVDYVRVKA